MIGSISPLNKRLYEWISLLDVSVPQIFALSAFGTARIEVEVLSTQV